MLLTACGPGEISGWALPLLDRIRRQKKGWRVSLVIWPHLLASGLEAQMAREAGEFDNVLDPGAALRLLAGGTRAGNWNEAPPSLLLHLGGSALLSLLLGRRLGCPVAAYAEKPPRFARRFRSIFCAYDGACRDAAGEIRPVGNLVVDAVAELKQQRLGLRGTRETPRVTVGLLPGSRPLQLRHGLPLTLPVAERIAQAIPGCRLLIARSPFTKPAALMEVLDEAKAKGRMAPEARILQSSDGLCLTGKGGLAIPIVDRREVFLQADLLASSPGTNSAEATALGIPSVTVVPFLADQPLFPGLAGHAERLPWLGKAGKRLLLHLLSIDMRYYSHANIRAGREIVPEIHGPLDPGRIAETLIGLLRDRSRLERMGAELTNLMGPSGAAGRLVEQLEGHFFHATH